MSVNYPMCFGIACANLDMIQHLLREIGCPKFSALDQYRIDRATELASQTMVEMQEFAAEIEKKRLEV